MFLEAKQRCKKNFKHQCFWRQNKKSAVNYGAITALFVGWPQKKTGIYTILPYHQEKMECTKHCFWTLKRWYLSTLVSRDGAESLQTIMTVKTAGAYTFLKKLKAVTCKKPYK